ncbi:MAG: hypothetical protein Rubg2KO_15600 [Rubricoccaceae bacterium]
MSLNIDRTTLALPRNQYVRRQTKKDLIVMHHTAGGSASSSVAWWKQNPERIATAYIIDRDGTIYECFDPTYWASHLGIGGAIERRSIGIELANWGWLKRRGSRFTNWAGNLVDEDVDVIERPWRGQRYWEAYTEAQIASSIALTVHLVERFGIDPDVAPAQWGEPDTRRFRRFRGIVGHHHVRADKTDISPAYPWERLTNEVEGGAVPKPVVIAPSGTDHVYVVERGDSLWALSRRFGVTVDRIRQLNALSGDTIHVGQTLRFA